MAAPDHPFGLEAALGRLLEKAAEAGALRALDAIERQQSWHDVMDVPTAARYLDCSPSTVHRQIREGMPGRKVGARWLVPRDALDTWLRGDT